MYDKGEEKKSKFIPFVESQVSHGSRDLSIGYPYWIIKSRLYGSGGMVFEQSKFYSKSLQFGIKHNFKKKYIRKK